MICLSKANKSHDSTCIFSGVLRELKASTPTQLNGNRPCAHKVSTPKTPSQKAMSEQLDAQDKTRDSLFHLGWQGAIPTLGPMKPSGHHCLVQMHSSGSNPICRSPGQHHKPRPHNP